MKVKILYEDNHIIVAYKPANVLSQADYSKDEDMLTILKEYIKEKYQKPGEVYLGLVHRLDRNTEGIMVFARTSKAAYRLAEVIKHGEFKKKYLAIVENEIYEKERELINFLVKNENNRKTYLSETGKEAKLKYRVIGEIDYMGRRLSLLDIELFTGRFHQIRCQLSAIGNPLFQDKKYNPKSNKSEYFLCAYSLKFKHPTLPKILDFCEYSENGLLKKFEKSFIRDL